MFTRYRPHSTDNVLKLIVLITATGLLAPVIVHAGDHDDDWREKPYCSQTARVALNACKNDVRDDRLLVSANCINFVDADERRECMAEAHTIKGEGREECFAAYEARLEVCDMLGEARYDPSIDPADFVVPGDIGDTVAPNPYFNLTPGYTRIYESGDETITVTVTDETLEIMGVDCTIIRDIVEIDGVLVEDTVDWHAQDIYGNVWYFGEIAQNFEDGILDNLDGSFMAGQDYAKPGIIMLASPRNGEVYREEWALSEAEDLAEIVSTSANESAAAADCNHACLQTRNWTPLEPDVTEFKFYSPGVGVIVEVNPDDPDDRVEIVDYFYQ